MMLDAMAPPLPPPTQRHHQTDTGNSPLVLIRASSSSPSPNATSSNSPSSAPSSSSSPTNMNSPSNKQQQQQQIHNKPLETKIKLQDQCKESHKQAMTTLTSTQEPTSSLNLHQNECSSILTKHQQQDSPTITTKIIGQAIPSNKAITLQANNHNNTTSGNTYQSRKFHSSNHHQNNLSSNYSTSINNNNNNNNGTTGMSNNNRLNNQQRNSHNSNSHVDQKNVYHHNYNQQQHSHNHSHSHHLHHPQQHNHFSQQQNHSSFGANPNQNDNQHHQQRSRHHNHHQTNQQQEFHMPTFNHLSQSEASLPSSDVASNTSSVTSQRVVNGPPHYVDLHVNAGECVSLQLLDGQEQVLTGPATITMISHQQNPPVPIPVQVPPGHMVHQIADEHGTLKHIILSIMVNEVDSSQLNSTIINLPHGSFSINELVDVGTTPMADDRDPLGQDANSAILHLPRQTHATDANHFASYDDCPIAAQPLDASIQRSKNNGYTESNILDNQAVTQQLHHVSINRDQIDIDEMRSQRKTTTDKSPADVGASKDGFSDLASRDKSNRILYQEPMSDVVRLSERTDGKESSQETHSTASGKSQNIKPEAMTTIKRLAAEQSAASTTDNRTDELVHSINEQQHQRQVNETEQQISQTEVFPASNERLLDASVPTSTAYQPIPNASNLDAMSGHHMMQTVDEQLYGYPQPCCCCYYCDPQQAAAATSSAASDDQQTPTVVSTSIVGQQDVIIMQPDHQQSASVAPTIATMSSVSSNRGLMDNVNSPSASIMPYHHQNHNSMMNPSHGSIGLPLGINSGPSMNSHTLHPLTGQNGLVPLASGGHFPEISGSGVGVPKVHRAPRPGNHFKQHKLHSGSTIHANPGDRRQGGYANHHYHQTSSYNNIADGSSHYNQEVTHTTPYNKSLLVHPKQNLPASQVISSGVHNAYPASYSSYGHRPTTMANIVSSGSNKSKHHVNSPMSMNQQHQTPQLQPSQAYRPSESEQNTTRSTRSDQNPNAANHFISNANSGFKFQGADVGNNNKRSPQQVISLEKIGKFNAGTRVLSGNQNLSSNSNQHQQHHHNSGSISQARSSSKKKSPINFDHHQQHYLQHGNQPTQQTSTKSLHNNPYQAHSALNSDRENSEFFADRSPTGARNLSINHEQEKSSNKQHISNRTASISPTIDKQNHQQNQISMNLGEKSDTTTLFDVSPSHDRNADDNTQSYGHETATKIKGNKKQSHESKDSQENEILGSDGNSYADESPHSLSSRNSRGKQKKSQSKTSPKQSNQSSSNSRNSTTEGALKTQRSKQVTNEPKSTSQQVHEGKARVKSQQKKTNNQHLSTIDTNKMIQTDVQSNESSAKDEVDGGTASKSPVIKRPETPSPSQVTEVEMISRKESSNPSDKALGQSPGSLKEVPHDSPSPKDSRNDPSPEGTVKVKLTSSRSSQSLQSESPARKKSKSSSQGSSKTSSPKINVSVPENKEDIQLDLTKSMNDEEDVLMITTTDQTEGFQMNNLNIEMQISSPENTVKTLDVLSSSEAKSTQTTPQKQVLNLPTIDFTSTNDEIQSIKTTTATNESLVKKKVEPKKKTSTGKTDFKLNSLPQVRLLSLNCLSIASNSVCLRWSYIPTMAEKFGINQHHHCHGSKQHSALYDHFVVESSSQKNSEANTLVAPKIVYQGCAMTCRINQLIPEKIYHFRIRRTALVAGGDEEQLAVSEILSVTLPGVQQMQQSSTTTKKSHSSGPKASAGNQNDNDPTRFPVVQTSSSLINRGNASSHTNNTHHHSNKSSGHQHNHHPIKFSNLVKQCRTKLVSAVGNLVRNSLSSYSDTKFAGLLLMLFTFFAMLLAIFIHLYIVAPVNE